MNIQLLPHKKVKGKISVPGSKSITNRALLMASLAKGDTTLKNALFSDDTKVMIEALRNLGVTIRKVKDGLKITGNGGKFSKPKKELNLGNAGTAVRFLTAISCLIPGKTIVTGDERMCERPIQDLIDGLNQLKIEAKFINENKCPPVEIPFQKFLGGKCEIRGNKSSQYFSALLMLAPLSKDKDTTIKVQGSLVSKPYIDITLKLLETFGIVVQNKDYKTFKIPANQKYKPVNLEVEADASSATYFMAFAAATEGEVEITNLGTDSIQGDSKFYKILEKMGCEVEATEKSITVKGPEKLKSIGDINMTSMPDSSMTLAVLASISLGLTTIKGIRNLRIKECNRLEALTKEFKKCGIYAKELKNGISIIGRPPRPADIETYNDHRMAMSFSILSLVSNGIKILEADCVNKTYPEFWTDVKKLGIKVVK